MLPLHQWRKLAGVLYIAGSFHQPDYPSLLKMRKSHPAAIRVPLKVYVSCLQPILLTSISKYPYLGLVVQIGLEPMTNALSERTSNQLNYCTMIYGRASRTRTCGRRLSGGRGWNRTIDARIFSPSLYRLSYPPKAVALSY